MTVAGLISNSINCGRNACCNSRQVGDNKLEITYKLSVPAWFDDKSWVISDNTRVVYSASKKKNINGWVVALSNINAGYPRVSSNKSITYSKVYSVEEFVKESNFSKFLTKERELIFREVKSNITLEKIGQLSKKYSTEIEGKYYDEEPINYGSTQYSQAVDKDNISNPGWVKIGQYDTTLQF